jgi:hypothetical protein
LAGRRSCAASPSASALDSPATTTRRSRSSAATAVMIPASITARSHRCFSGCAVPTGWHPVWKPMKGTCNGTAHARRVIRLAYQSLCELGLSYRATQRRLEEGGTRVPDGQLINWLRHVECAHRAGPSPSDPPGPMGGALAGTPQPPGGPPFGDDGLQQDRDGALQRLAVRLTFMLAGGGRGCPGRGASPGRWLGSWLLKLRRNPATLANGVLQAGLQADASALARVGCLSGRQVMPVHSSLGVGGALSGLAWCLAMG